MSCICTDGLKRINFTPVNRYVYVTPPEEPEEFESPVLLPEDYKKESAPVVTVSVIKPAADCNLKLKKCDNILVESHMLREIFVEDVQIHIILENYILGTY